MTEITVPFEDLSPKHPAPKPIEKTHIGLLGGYAAMNRPEGGGVWLLHNQETGKLESLKQTGK